MKKADYKVMFEIKQGKDFPTTIQQLLICVLKNERKEKLKKIFKNV